MSTLGQFLPMCLLSQSAYFYKHRHISLETSHQLLYATNMLYLHKASDVIIFMSDVLVHTP